MTRATRKRVTLTFDNGPDPDVTPRVLDILRDERVPSHFFVLGKHVATDWGRRCVERARDEGHIVGNHSYSHEVPLGEDPSDDAVAREIIATEALLAPLGLGPRRFRPFGGGGKIGPHLFSKAARAHLEAHEYTCVVWNAVPRDWVDPAWTETAFTQCEALDHAVVVVHDIANASLASLPAFIAAVRARGWELTQDLPDDCVPMKAGKSAMALAMMTAD